MKKIMFSIMIISNLLFAQANNMKITQGTGSTYINASEIDTIKFVNSSTSFVCGDVILYGGETYQTVLIGSQCWFQKNLNIGARINIDTEQINNNTIEKYCINNLEANCITFGGLYQWAEAVQYLNGATNTESPGTAFPGNVQGICPTDWHIPSDAEFATLKTTVSSDNKALKVIGQGIWTGVGTNTSGFSALLAGYVFNGAFYSIVKHSFHWSSTNVSGILAGGMILPDRFDTIDPGGGDKTAGMSIRCVKD